MDGNVSCEIKQKTPLFLKNKDVVNEMYLTYCSLEERFFIAPITAGGSSEIAKTAVNKFNCGVLYGENHSVNNFVS